MQYAPRVIHPLNQFRGGWMPWVQNDHQVLGCFWEFHIVLVLVAGKGVCQRYTAGILIYKTMKSMTEVEMTKIRNSEKRDSTSISPADPTVVRYRANIEFSVYLVAIE